MWLPSTAEGLNEKTGVGGQRGRILSATSNWNAVFIDKVFWVDVVAAVCLFACGACSIVGLLYEIRQEHNKIRNLLYKIATLRTAGRGLGGFGGIVGGSVVVPFAATAIALLCLAAALAALSAALFQTIFS